MAIRYEDYILNSERIVLKPAFKWLAIFAFGGGVGLPVTWWISTSGGDLFGLRGPLLIVAGAFSSAVLLYVFAYMRTGSLEVTEDGIRRVFSLRLGGSVIQRDELATTWEGVHSVTDVRREGALKLSGVVVYTVSGDGIVVSSMWGAYYRAVVSIAQRVPEKLSEEGRREALKAESLVIRERDFERTSS